MTLSAIRASFLSIPVQFLHLWHISLLMATLVHERRHPALAILVLAPVSHVLFNLIATLHPLAKPRSREEENNWKELVGFSPVTPLSRAWFGRALLITSFCGLGTVGLVLWYGSFDLLRSDYKTVGGSLQWWFLLFALIVFSIVLFGPLLRAGKRFARASGLTDSRPWRALVTGLGVWLWCDAIFAAIHQQLSLLCQARQPVACGGSVAFTESLASFSQALYFSTMTLATVGYGDIAPVAVLARALVTVEVVVGIGLLGFILGRVASFAPPAIKSG